MGKYAIRNSKKGELIKAKSDFEIWKKVASRHPIGTMAGDTAARRMQQAEKLVAKLTAETR